MFGLVLAGIQRRRDRYGQRHDGGGQISLLDHPYIYMLIARRGHRQTRACLASGGAITFCA
ncbi:Uncharacterised protein [Bordetella pertussis]|nr:Uncharacterised protein [Bordetella pertussis]